MIVRHYKGGEYEVLAETIQVNRIPNNYFGHIEAKHTETGEEVLAFRQIGGGFLTEGESYVIYRSLDDENFDNLYARPKEMFWENVKVDGDIVHRFRPLVFERTYLGTWVGSSDKE